MWNRISTWVNLDEHRVDTIVSVTLPGVEKRKHRRGVVLQRQDMYALRGGDSRH